MISSPIHLRMVEQRFVSLSFFALFQLSRAISTVNYSNNIVSPPSSLTSSSVLDNPSFQAFQKGDVPLVCIPEALPRHLVDSIRYDATTLASTGIGTVAGIGASRSKQTSIRRNVVQTWIQSPNSPPSQKMPFLLGDMDARRKLLQFVDTIRSNLQQETNDYNQDVQISQPQTFGYPLLPPELVELSYLNYEPGSYYKRHVDVINRGKHLSSNQDGSVTRQGGHKRAISMILFLGDGSKNDDDFYYEDEDFTSSFSSSQRPWDVKRDGGALRIHEFPFVRCTGQPYRIDDDNVFSDIPPIAGTMVLFNSAQVPHEVLETKRNRVCVVAWFRTPE